MGMPGPGPASASGWDRGKLSHWTGVRLAGLSNAGKLDTGVKVLADQGAFDALNRGVRRERAAPEGPQFLAREVETARRHCRRPLRRWPCRRPLLRGEVLQGDSRRALHAVRGGASGRGTPESALPCPPLVRLEEKGLTPLYCGLLLVVDWVVVPPLAGSVSVFECVSELPAAPCL